MANPEHLAILKQGVEVWNKWRQEHPDLMPDLSGADLQSASLGGRHFPELAMPDGSIFIREHFFPGVNLSGADLRETRLSGADLARANFGGTDLRKADLSEAGLSGVVLSEADLSRATCNDADLRGAVLQRATLSYAALNGADLGGSSFNQAVLGYTSFVDTNLKGVVGLDSCRHWARSFVDSFTLIKSGALPVRFLRGCGLPDNFIDNLPSQLHQAIQYYSCFISYSTKDQAFADRLYADLQAAGVRCWFAPHDIKGGRKIHEQLDEAIRLHDKLLLILSEHSMASEWVKTEIGKARKREAQEKRRMLFPIALVPYDPVINEWECFDADRGKDSAREIREYFIPDFSNWKNHNSYQEALGRLVSDLKAG
jgi:uncharacterized protein YjbI with pentapeptide repeats